MSTLQGAETLENGNSKKANIDDRRSDEMEVKRRDELNLPMQAQSSSATVKLRADKRAQKSVKKVESAIEAAAKKATMKQIENETETFAGGNDVYEAKQASNEISVASDSRRKKRKPKYVRHVIHDSSDLSLIGMEDAAGLGVQEQPMDLSNSSKRKECSNRNPPDKIISGSVPDKVMSGEQTTSAGNSLKTERSANSQSKAKRRRAEPKSLNFNRRYGNRTFSTFTSTEQELLRREASRLYEGATFRSFCEFERYFEAYKIVGNYPFRVASSEVLRDGEGKVIERFKYKYIVFHCAHYGSPRKRGGGKRPNQSYLPLGCKARFRLNADTANGYLRISSFHEEHENHDNCEDDYFRVVSKKRRNLIDGPKSKIAKETKEKEKGGKIPDEETKDEPVTNANEGVNDDTNVKVNFTAVADENCVLDLSPQGSSAFVPVTSFRFTDMSQQNERIQPMMQQQNIPPTNCFLQVLMMQMSRFQHIESLILNEYIVKCGPPCLPENLHAMFIRSIYGADCHLSDWTDAQLRDVIAILRQPVEILLEGKLPSDISMDEVNQIQSSRIQRVLTILREEKEKRFNASLSRLTAHVYAALYHSDLQLAVQGLGNFASDLGNLNGSTTETKQLSA